MSATVSTPLGDLRIPPKPAPGLTDAQRALRRTGVGGSEVAAVLGEATRTTEDGAIRSPFDVWLAKTSSLESIDSVDAERGRFLEPSVVAWYCQRTGLTQGLAPGTVVHATKPWALCTPDALVNLPDARSRLVSVKCPRHAWDWGEPGTDDVPRDYALQLQWEHAVCSSFLPAGSLDEQLDLACFVGGELRIYVMRADVELQTMMLDAVGEWWERHMVRGETPPIDASSGARTYLKRRWKNPAREVREATPYEAVLLSELRALREQTEALKPMYETARRRVEEAIADAGGISSDEGVVTWRARKDGVRVFDQTWRTK